MSTDEISTPDYLYHYTSIEALSLILKTKKIKLKRLDKVNDPTEELSRDGKYGKYLFVTCWTSQLSEILPFWYMYGHNSRGIRIGLPINFIMSYKVRAQVHETGGSISYGNCFDSIIPEEELFTSDHLVANYIAMSNKFFPMEYTDDSKLLKPPILNQNDDGGLTVALDALGRHKPTIWGFEEEWRYKLIIHPYSIKEANTSHVSARRAFENQEDLGFEDYFLCISDEAYSQMEVRLGPLCTESDQIMVEALIHKYNPAALLNPSDLKGRVR
ncbi:MAG: hypothetical protein KBF68_09800 [Nitrosomonas sp.]|jgi:hypothetical protein|nr:hypothetical protein [Nitrosomonas sp.]MBP9101642.1 hypothetical protein [Nitrosomonas sp.]